MATVERFRILPALRGVVCNGILLLGLAVAPAAVYAQKPDPARIPESLTADLETAVQQMISADQVREAVPYLEELARRFENSTGDLFLSKLERFYFYLGLGYLQSDQFREAIGVLEKHADKFPRANDAPLVMEWLADSYRRIAEYQTAADLYARLRGLHQLNAATAIQVLAKEADCLVALQAWNKAVPLLQTLLNRAQDSTLQGHAAATLAQAYLETEQLDQIVALLPVLFRHPAARCDVNLNLLLLQGGDLKYAREEYADALLLFQLVRTKEALIAWHEEELRAATAAWDQARNLGRNYERVLALQERRQRLKTDLQSLLERKSWSEDLLLRKAQTFFQLHRRWEAMWTYWAVWRDFPRGALARQALYSAFSLAGELGMDARAREMGMAFINDFGPGDFFDDVSLQVAQLDLRRAAYADAIAVCRKARQLHPAHAFADRLLFIEGYSQFQTEQLDQAVATLAEVRSKYPQSPALEGADYWTAMARLFQQNYQAARDEFSEFLARYIGGVYFEDASFRRGVAEYGLARFADARLQLEQFIRDFPANPLRSEALALLGDIAAAEGRLDDALDRYREVEKYTRNMTQIDYATFQVGKILELEARFDDMARHFQNYLAKYGTKGQYTPALWRMGFAKQQTGDVAGMLKLYEQAIRLYGNQPDAAGLDSILRDWVRQYQGYHHRSPTALLEDMARAATTNGRETLRWRALWALATLPSNAPPQTPNMTLKDLERASPAVLVWMGRQQTNNTVLARAAFQRVLDRYADTDWCEEAMLGLADLEEAIGNRRQARELLHAFGERFPTAPSAGLALKREADLLRLEDRPDEAIELYLKVLENKDWRGPLWPECLYQVGLTHLEHGDLRKAFAYFQRVYVLYDGYPEWTARAYLQSGICLEKLNRRQEAVATYEEMLGREAFRGRPEYTAAREHLERLQ